MQLNLGAGASEGEPRGVARGQLLGPQKARETTIISLPFPPLKLYLFLVR